MGASTGRWQDAAIQEQAEDVLACVAALLSDENDTPVGLFGHSQGGWVVVEAASRDAPIAFVVASSGPGVTPAEQERYSPQRALERAGLSPDLVDAAMRGFDEVVAMLRARAALEETRARVREAKLGEVFEQIELPLHPQDPDEWNFVGALIDYDPRPALERLRVPLLGLFGGDDRLVPVEESVSIYRAALRPDLLTVAVLPGADHRVQVGEPPRLADDYLTTLSTFVAEAAA